MSAPDYAIQRCAACGMSFEVFFDSPQAARIPFVCDEDWARWRTGDPRPTYDPRAGTAAVVSRNPAENVPVQPHVTPLPPPPAMTAQQAANALVPSFDHVLEQVDPDEAARQRAAAATDARERGPGVVAEPEPDAALAGPPTRSPGVDVGLATMAMHSQPSDDKHAPVENVTKGDTDPLVIAAHVAEGQDQARPATAGDDAVAD